jgi:hypothetical protein
MTETYRSGCAGGAIRGHAAALRVADRLYLAAAPTFAIMALLTCVLGVEIAPGVAMRARSKHASHIDPPATILRHHAEGALIPTAERTLDPARM